MCRHRPPVPEARPARRREPGSRRGRSGDRAAIAAYLGSGDRFDRALAQFAETYAEQNERDYAALKRVVERGEVTAEAGV